MKGCDNFMLLCVAEMSAGFRFRGGGNLYVAMCYGKVCGLSALKAAAIFMFLKPPRGGFPFLFGKKGRKKTPAFFVPPKKASAKKTRLSLTGQRKSLKETREVQIASQFVNHNRRPAKCKTKENCKLEIHRGCYGKVARLILFAVSVCRYDKVAALTAFTTVTISMPDGLRTFPLTNDYGRVAGAKAAYTQADFAR